jgi:hypothetical protein
MLADAVGGVDWYFNGLLMNDLSQACLGFVELESIAAGLASKPN